MITSSAMIRTRSCNRTEVGLYFVGLQASHADLRNALLPVANARIAELQSANEAKRQAEAAAAARAAAAAAEAEKRLTVDITVNVPLTYKEGQDAAQVCKRRC